MRRSWMGLVALLAGVLIWNAAARSEGEETAEPGKELFLANKCNSCHMVSKEGIEKRSSKSADAAGAEKGQSKEGGEAVQASASKSKRRVPDLSGVGLSHDAEWMTKYLQKVEAKNGKKHRKKFKGTDEDLGVLTAWLASLKHETEADESGETAASDGGAASEGHADKASTAESEASEDE